MASGAGGPGAGSIKGTPLQINGVIYLTAPVDLLMSRIAQRGREYETPIEPAYLDALSGAYARWFRESVRVPVIEIDTSRVDLVGCPSDYEALLEALPLLHRLPAMRSVSVPSRLPNVMSACCR